MDCLADVHALHSFPEVDEFNTLGIPASVLATEALLSTWIEGQGSLPRTTYIFQIERITDGQFIGLAALNLGKLNYHIAETWYKIHPAYWGQGYASEALTRLLAFGFKDLNLHRIEAGCAVENGASVRVLEKAGFIREGRKREILPIRGRWVDNYFYAILDSDFEKAKP